MLSEAGLGWSTATTAQLALLVARPPAGISTSAAMGWFSGATGLGNVAAVLGGISAELIGLRAAFLLLAATPLRAALLMAHHVGALASTGEPRVSAPRAPLRSVVRMPLAVWAGVLVMFFIN